jgi:glutathione synthase/RimK-type ligase-like ATP-grasp enzyme
MPLYTVGLWIPTRTSLSPISIERPGMWMESLKADFLAALARQADYQVIDGLDFRQAHIRSGDVYLGDRNLAALDVFFWFGEIDRGHASYHLNVLDALGQRTRVVNGAGGQRIALDKLLTQLHLRRHGVPVPEFLAVSRDIVYDVRGLVERKPFLLKPRLGSFGVGITRVEGFDQLVDIIDYSEQPAHFLEELIDSTPEGFIGVNVIGDTVVSGYGKEPSAFHGWKVFDRGRRGGHMVPRRPSPEQEQIAQKVARVTGLDLLGVDIVRSREGRDYVVDVNTFPGLYPSLNAHFGHDVAQLCVDVIARKLGPASAVARPGADPVAEGTHAPPVD